MTSQLSHTRHAPPSGPNRLLLAADPTLTTHLSCYGPPPNPAEPGGPTAAVAAAGLRGRGGAGFPVADKMAAVAAGRAPVVIANGAEGEPDSHKDATLLTRAPHLVLDGLSAAAEAVGARECHLYAPAALLEPVRAALAQRRSTGYDRRPVTLTPAAESFLSGEKTAVINRLAGRRPIPGDQLISTSRAGLHGRPTLVHNVETLAQLALIARYGPDWYRSAGTHEEPGTFLVTLSGTTAAGVVETPFGTSLLDLITRTGRTDPRTVRAVLIGGYHGTWIPGSELSRTTLSAAGLRPLNARLGAGVVRVLPYGHCGLRATADIIAHLAAASAGQCGPCRNGLPELATRWHELTYRGTGDPREIARLTDLVDGRGACHHPDGTARLLRSALHVFADDIDLHRQGACTAGHPSNRGFRNE
ncbi:NADH-ubiquinone oxidoreductase-F iron-sulfur binding region domain-containing protein [Nocardia sp. alder85J]|uniref:NADH-ubiquinone oxidoreductase-F iron-sulfur binding region domain-containing protein n=1 Tax=Nocardia sp. alder85J TaxID=2862949 RepID=UPI001CD77DE2|nr:NADH-ubiquinone oxidoreductase-F iron-sulfur binding region domain-containing protein [Nocardia sp. alder85J]MCX4095801.1 NADH-quinone oxidoreductase subunit F [Nocardia sp. alder85J]